MANRINRAIELLAADQAIYYIGAHTGHVLTYEQGRAGRPDLGRLHQCRHGARRLRHDRARRVHARAWSTAGRPAPATARPTVIVEAPVNGIDEPNVRSNAWQFRQILARGVHGILLCQAEIGRGASRAFVEACRYPHRKRRRRRQRLGVGTRGRGSEPTAAPIWGTAGEEYLERCDPWPLNPAGELLLGVKLESPEGVANCEEILAVPGLGFAEIGPGDLGLSLGYTTLQRDPYPPEMQEARASVFAACRRNRLAFLEGATPENIAARIDEGVRVIAGHARAGHGRPGAPAAHDAGGGGDRHRRPPFSCSSSAAKRGERLGEVGSGR